MKKKLIALLLVLTVSAVGFTGCGNKEEAADAGNDANNAQVEETTDEETEDVAEPEEVEEEIAEEDEAALEEEQQTEDQTQEEVKPEEEKAPEKVEDKTEAKPETKPQDKPAKEEQTAKPETKPEAKPEASKPAKEDKPAKEEVPASKPQTGNASNSSSSTSGSNGATGDQPQEEQGGNSSNAPAAGESAAQTLKSKFNSAIKSSKDLDTVANSIISDLPLATATMPVEEGYLNGFTDEIKGFNSGVMFGPMIGSIPFIGYVFETDDADALIKLLKSKADLRWNICTAADEMATAKSGNYVFFVMAPTTFEE